MALHYGTTLDQVQAWVPHITVDVSSEPTAAQVLDFVAQADNNVFFALAAVAELDHASDLYAAVLDQAQRLVAMYAAADAYDTHFPERATDPQEWGARTRARCDTLVANLALFAQQGIDVPDSEIVPAGVSMATPGQGGCVDNPLFVSVIDPRPDFAETDSLTGCLR